MLRCWTRTLLSLLLLLSLIDGFRADASGPHWVAGVNYFNPAAKGEPGDLGQRAGELLPGPGSLVEFRLKQPGRLACGRGAAAVWSNVPTAALAITNGGSLSEDVSGSNVTANTPAGTGATLPTDAQPTATSKPVAVIFDADGSVIDDTYGIGASDPNSCTTHWGCTRPVDNFSTAGKIAHAVILVNGLCASSSALEGLLQYELVRAFGRVLGAGLVPRVNEWIVAGG